MVGCGLAERVRAHLDLRPAKRSLRRWLSRAEMPMAELEEHHGCRRAQRRGRDQVRIQALGAAMASTLRSWPRRIDRNHSRWPWPGALLPTSAAARAGRPFVTAIVVALLLLDGTSR
jgi:hypothetical protein